MADETTRPSSSPAPEPKPLEGRHDARPLSHEHHEPDFISAVREDLSDWRQWLSRAVVLAFAIAAGLAVVLFTWVSDQAISAFAAMRSWSPWAPLIWTPCCTAALVWVTRRFAPGAAGSGIPHVMAALSTRVPASQQGLFVSLRLSIAKLLLVSGGLLGGLAIGREGPSVQIAAGVMQHAQRWLPRRSALNHDGLLVAGGAAGIAAAFNAPLAGVMFAIEELTRKLEQMLAADLCRHTANIRLVLTARTFAIGQVITGRETPAPVAVVLALHQLALVVRLGRVGGEVHGLVDAALARRPVLGRRDDR